MSVCEAILELAEEMVNPDEAILDDQMEETIDNELDALSGVGDDDDSLIDFIDKGSRLTNVDPIDYTDYEVDDTLEDENNTQEEF